MEIGVQIVSLAVILAIVITFFENRRLPLLSTRLFTGFILLALFNILSEFSTLYTIYRIDQIEPWKNRLCHQCFIGSLDLMIFFLFLYVDVKSRQQKRYSLKQAMLRLGPVCAATVMVIFGQLNYYIGTDGRYSYGVMAMTVYCSIAVYVLLIMVQLFRGQKWFEKNEKRNILYGVIVWTMIAVIQFFHPTLLLSSMGVALMTLFVYISFENPREYMDYEIPHALNDRAYDVVMQNQTAQKKPFFYVSLAIVNENLLRNTYGNQELLRILDTLAARMEEHCHTVIYHSDKGVITAILPDREAALDPKLTEVLHKTGRELNEMADLRISILECPAYAASPEEIRNVSFFVNQNKKDFPPNARIVIEKKIIDQLNYLEMIERIVQKAICEDGLEVYYQPIYSVKQGRFVSAEALVRLKDRDTAGYISPEIFIPIAEKRNMIGELGKIVFEKVCRFYSDYRLEQMGVEYIEVNLSGKQIVDRQLPAQLLQCAKKWGVSPGHLNLEITETAAVEAEERLKDHMRILQNAGFGFSMDDFGTGYSNLSEMRNTEFDLIKLDKSLIWPCFEAESREALVILDACVNMIHRLGKQIVAEGVETKEQAELLSEKGIAYLQGYYYSRPLPEQAYLQFMLKKDRTGAAAKGGQEKE
ncbi:MAG: EAL domain-containing protein [Lachnospiraceae bacterium]|nr:EAL domain-containing protein [Lachnospiraceae bacterium]